MPYVNEVSAFRFHQDSLKNSPDGFSFAYLVAKYGISQSLLDFSPIPALEK
jgi:hypothetical protein